ncbi:MAG: glutathione peroxidase [Planctomycetota bacterium]
MLRSLIRFAVVPTMTLALLTGSAFAEPKEDKSTKAKTKAKDKKDKKYKAEAKAGDDQMPALAFTMKDINGNDHDLRQYSGKVVLFVNVASKCGFTGQYKGLQALYAKYKDKGLVVIGVPANDYGKQEPGTNEEIKSFCTGKYSVTFPMLEKVHVKGKDICPLYKFLTSKKADHKHGGDVEWNFTKILVGRNGNVVDRFDSRTAPDDDKLVKAVEKALKDAEPATNLGKSSEKSGG